MTAPGRRPFVIALLVIAALALAVRWHVAARPLVDVDDRVLIDDSYLSLTIARSLARGEGPLYGLAPTNGYQPLYVWLMAPAFKVWPLDPEPPVRAALVLLALADAATLVVLAWLVLRTTGSRAAALSVAAIWALDPYATATALNGLETSIATLTTVLALFALERWRGADRAARGKIALATGLALGVGALTRVDGLALWPVAFLVLLRAGGATPGERWGAIVRTFGVAGAVFAIWPIVSFASTGAWIPVSGRAVRHMVLSSYGGVAGPAVWEAMLQKAANVILRRDVPWIAGGLAAAFLAVTLGGGRRALPGLRALAPARDAAVFAALLTLAYVFVVFGPWHFERYLFPWAVAGALAIGALLAPLWRARPALAALALAVAIAGSVASPSFARLHRRATQPWGYLRIGEWAARTFPPGTIVGGSQTGAIGYFADSIRVVNLDGVVNAAALEAMMRGRLADHVRDAGVRWLVWQDDIEFLERESHASRPLVITRVREIDGIRTWSTPWTLWSVRDSVAAGATPDR